MINFNYKSALAGSPSEQDDYQIGSGKYNGGMTFNKIGSRYKKGGEVKSLKDHVGMIKGPGTGTSDSIDAKLPVHGFVIPANAVKAIGPENINKMMMKFDKESPMEDMMEGKEEVPAKVSNGEYWIPPHIVKQTGPDFWSNLVQSATGKMPMPEVDSEVVKAASGGYFDDTPGSLLEAKRQSADYMRNTIQQNQADVFKDRVANAAQNRAGDIADLRSRVNTGFLNDAQKPIQPSINPRSDTGLQSGANTGSYAPPLPKTSVGNTYQFGGAGSGALSTGLAYDVLTSPKIAGARDSAISGLKQKAGFDENSTPFNYKCGGHVKKYAGGGESLYDSLDEEEKKRLQIPSQNVSQEFGKWIDVGGNALINSISDFAKNQTIKPFKEIGEQAQGYMDRGAGPGYAYPAAYMDQQAKVRKQYGDILSGAADSAGKFFQGPQDSTTQPTKRQGAENTQFTSGQNDAVNMPGGKMSGLKDQVNPELIAPQPMAQSKQANTMLDENGFYTVYGPNGSQAKVLDWNTTSDDLKLTPEQYQQQIAAKRMMEIQNALTTPAYEEEFAQGKHGTQSSSKSSGFRPDMPNVGSGKEKDARLAFEMFKYQQDQEQNQKKQPEQFKNDQEARDYADALNYSLFGDDDETKIRKILYLKDNFKNRYYDDLNMYKKWREAQNAGY